jgi:membrane fusion protein, multidrug efflux system
LNAGKQINIEVGIPENVINGIELEMITDITFSAIQDEFKGEVIEIAPSLDPSTATYLVKIEILEANSAIRPGMAANVTINLSAQAAEDNAIVIPIKAVGEDGDGNFVLLVEVIDDETAMIKKQKVEIGDLTGNGFKIISGISEGQKIATAGLQTLLNGQKVRL